VPAPSREQAAGRGPLTLATWNLSWLFAAEGKGQSGRTARDFAELRQYVERLNADVVAFQEVDGEQAARRVFDPAVYAFVVGSRGGAQRTGFAYRKQLSVKQHAEYAELDLGDLRSGVDLTVFVGARELRLLTVHLKSRCFEGPLDRSRHCQKLARQVPVLEAWIDARAREGTPFAVLGDFNRRFFKGGHGARDAVWAEIDDGEPPESDLWSPTEGRRSQCWDGRHPDFIDHIVLSRSARALFVPGSFAELLYAEPAVAPQRTLSDHCPLSVVLAEDRASVPPAREPSPAVATRAEPEAAPDVPSSGAPRDEVSPPADGIAIKGNINAEGDKIYHLPGCASYADTRIHQARGERWFATEAAAQRAGWRKARNCP
jgi:endonuclease/exonuclease/phosphatase family metal-dependent hydrolase